MLPRSALQRHRRDKIKAASNGSAIMKELLRLRVVLKRRLTDASDCRRMMRLATAVRSRGASLDAAFLLLLVDRALRRPKLSAMLVRCFEKHQAKSTNSMEAAWAAVVEVRRTQLARRQNAVFWKGAASLSCRDFVLSLTAPTVVDVIGRLQLGVQPVDVTKAMNTLCELPQVSSYSAFAMLRVLRAWLHVRLCGAETAARTMSDTVKNMEKIVPLRSARRLSAAASGCALRDVDEGDGALVLCESSKALVVLGVLPAAAASEWSIAAVQASLASKATAALINTLRRQQPITDMQLGGLKCPRAEESDQVDAALPKTKKAFDHAPHYCVGSEMVAGILIKPLRNMGWLDENFGAHVFDDIG